MREIAFCATVALAFSAAVSWGAVQEPGNMSSMQLPRCEPMPIAVQMHACAVIGKRLYVFGGDLTTTTQQVWGKKVFSAEISDAETLGPWRLERELPEYRAYTMSSTEVINNRVYIVGGESTSRFDNDELQMDICKDALWSTVLADGSLCEWKRTEPFPGNAVKFASTCSSDKYLFVIGGRGTGNQPRMDVLVANANPDGGLSSWRVAGKAPVPLVYHGSALLEDRIYVWGGVNASTKENNQRVFSTVVRPDGSIGEWKDETPMPMPVDTAGFCGFNDYLIAIAGRYAGGIPTNTIWYAQLDSKRVTHWRGVKTDLNARVYHSLGLDKSRGIVFVTGGQKRLRPLARTEVPEVLSTVQTFRLMQSHNSKLESPKAAGAGSRTVQALSLDQAFAESERSGKEVLALFYSPEVPACKRFWDNAVSTPAFVEVAKDYVFATVDTSKQDMQACYTYGVFRVPALVVLGRDKQVQRKAMGPTGMEDVKAMLATGY